jgi:hypothetical protein
MNGPALPVVTPGHTTMPALRFAAMPGDIDGDKS